MVVVFDTNVFISALNYRGNERALVELFRKNKLPIAISAPILKEIERTLKEKFNWAGKPVQETLQEIETKSTIVNPQTKLSVIKEKESDNRILECAIEAKANFIITGDKKHLLPLKEFRGIKILSPREFLNQMGL